MRKHGLKVLGLVLMAAVGLMAFSATSALAVVENPLNLGDNFYSNNETPPEFLQGGTLFPAGLATQAIKGAQIGSGTFLAIPKKGAEIICTSGEATGTVANEYENWKTGTVGAPKMETGAHAHATLTFKGCKMQKINEAGELTGEELKFCVPNPETPGVITADVLLLGKKHKEPVGGTAKTYVVAVPLVNTKAKAEANEALTSSFTILKFGELCSLPSPTKFSGSFSFLAPTVDAIKPILEIATLKEQELIGAKLSFGVSPAFMQSKWEVELVGKNVPWGAM